MVILAGGVIFLLLGIWWFNLPGLRNGGIVWLFSGAVFLIGGLLKLKKSPRK